MAEVDEMGPDLREIPLAVARVIEVANGNAVVGPALERDGRTVIPLAVVAAGYGFGLGFGQSFEEGQAAAEVAAAAVVPGRSRCWNCRSRVCACIRSWTARASRSRRCSWPAGRSTGSRRRCGRSGGAEASREPAGMADPPSGPGPSGPGYEFCPRIVRRLVW